MFFSPELLLKRESGYGLLWLAATIGAKAPFKKIHKKSILSADITKLCQLVKDPEEHLALRLSSNLLVGVARVHYAQHDMFYQDAMTAYHTLKRAFAEITSDNLMQGPFVVRRDHITLEETSYALDFDLDFADAHWIDTVPPAPSLTPLQENDFPGSLSSGSQQRQRQHLLEDHYEYTSGGPSDDLAQDREDDYNREFGEGEVDLALDWNAIDELRPPAHDDGKFKLSILPHDDVDMNMNDNEEPWDVQAHHIQRASGLDQPDGNPRTRLASEDTQLGNPRISGAIAGSATANSRFPSQEFNGNENENGNGRLPNDEDYLEDLPQPKLRANRKKRKLGAGAGSDQVSVLDLSIELTDDQLKDMRNGYEERMLAEKEVLRAKKEKSDIAHNIQNLLHAPFLGMLDQGFNSWWSERTKMRYDDHANAGRVGDGFATPSCPPAKRSKGSHPSSDDIFSPAPGAFAPVGDHGGGVRYSFEFQDQMETVDFGDYTGSGIVGEEKPPFGSNADIENGRRGSSQPTSHAGSHLDGPHKSIFSKDNVSSNNQNQARSQRDSAAYPWSQLNVASSSVVGGAASGRSGFGPSSSAQSDVQLGPRGGGSQDGGFVDEDFPLGENQDPAALEDDSQRTDMGLLTLERTLESESLLFLQHLRLQVNPMSRKTTFKKYLNPHGPVQLSRRIAATAFYHVLALSTKGHVRVQQDEAYEDIRIQLTN
ncbi:hypothetical protein FRB94_013022 [Tulasnella sp. JGI-2019a]|nr:hypothetical protein FRB94_013022 [Tulasnella sp. JGI-2019a]